MKCIMVFLCLIMFTNKGLTNRVVIHTSNQIGPLYQFFPLKTNFLTFSVKATNDIHVCLTNTPMLKTPYYEIAVGGWSNTKSIIRKDSPDNQAEHSEKILNPDKFQTIWIITNDTEGSISVGKRPGDQFLYFKDPDFVKMSYFGISTGYGSNGEWNFDFSLFNCDCCNTN